MNVSIIIPYNTDRGWLKDAVRSCEEQDFSGDFEVVIYHGVPWLSHNFNEALEQARGEFIKICHDDDLLLPNCIQVLYDNIRDDLICGNAINFEGQKEEIYKSEIPVDLRTLALENTIHGVTVLYRRSSLERAKVNGQVFREELFTGEEYDLHLRMMQMGMKFNYVDCQVARYRIHPGQKSIGVMTDEQRRRRFDQILEIKRRYV